MKNTKNLKNLSEDDCPATTRKRLENAPGAADRLETLSEGV